MNEEQIKSIQANLENLKALADELDCNQLPYWAKLLLQNVNQIEQTLKEIAWISNQQAQFIVYLRVLDDLDWLANLTSIAHSVEVY